MKKHFLKYWTVLSYLTFYPQKKVAPPLIRVEKKFLQIRAYKVSKEAEFCDDFKSVQKSWVWQKGKLFLQKTEFLGTWKILQKTLFLRKNLWELLGARVLHIFKISAKFPLLLIPFAPNLEEIFFNSYKGQCWVSCVNFLTKTPASGYGLDWRLSCDLMCPLNKPISSSISGQFLCFSLPPVLSRSIPLSQGNNLGPLPHLFPAKHLKIRKKWKSKQRNSFHFSREIGPLDK